MAVLRCTAAFVYAEDNGVLRVLRPGDLVESDDPAAKKAPNLFEPVEANAHRSTERAIEQATAAPGEKRNRSRKPKADPEECRVAMFPVADQRILRGASAILSWQAVDGDGEPAAPSGTVTVGIVNSAGDTVIAPLTATDSDDDLRTYTFDVSDNLDLDFLTVTWTDDDGDHETTVEVVGGYYFSIAEARASDTTLENVDRYPAETIIATRREVEEEFERICSLAFVPRFATETLHGCGNAAQLDNNAIRDIRTVGDWSQTQIDTLVITDSGRLSSVLVPVWFTDGTEIAYEHGLDRPPAEVKRAALQRLRYRLNMALTGIPDRASSFTVSEGGTYKLDTAGTAKTGQPDVDAVLGRWSRRFPRVA